MKNNIEKITVFAIGILSIIVLWLCAWQAVISCYDGNGIMYFFYIIFGIISGLGGWIIIFRYCIHKWG